MTSLLDKAAAAPCALTHRELVELLTWPDAEALFKAAYEVKTREVGRIVSFRGLVEFGNICEKDCFYCGIRRSNRKVRRYRLAADEILREAEWTFKAGYGSLVLQSGETTGEANVAFVEDVLRRIHTIAGDAFGITISLGEQSEDTYQRWRKAGAHRYLLRIETSNPTLYAKLHPSDHSWERRRDCLRALRRCGYQVGTGVMAGLPGQTLDDLAADIAFFATENVDMIGMGPYIPHPDTPLGQGVPWTDEAAKKRLELGLRMIAATRLYLHDVNIAAATALQALDPEGREKGLLAGANVMMPNVTDPAHRTDYQLYTGKPCLNDNASVCRSCLERRIAAIGETVNWSKRGDSPHCSKTDNQVNCGGEDGNRAFPEEAAMSPQSIWPNLSG